VEAIVAPHSGTAGRVLTFTTSDKARTYELPSDLAFEAGKVYAFDVTLTNIAVTDGNTNCFMVAPNATLNFAVTQAYSSGSTLRVGGTYTGEFGVAVVWNDASVVSGTPSVSGSGNNALVTVKTTGNLGNAVVKVGGTKRSVHNKPHIKTEQRFEKQTISCARSFAVLKTKRTLGLH
jgi:hypothetical protein